MTRLRVLHLHHFQALFLCISKQRNIYRPFLYVSLRFLFPLFPINTPFGRQSYEQTMCLISGESWCIFCLHSCQTCTIKSFNHCLSNCLSEVTNRACTHTHTHRHFFCTNLYVTELCEGWQTEENVALLLLFFLPSLNCAHIPLMIRAGTTNSNVGRHS